MGIFFAHFVSIMIIKVLPKLNLESQIYFLLGKDETAFLKNFKILP